MVFRVESIKTGKNDDLAARLWTDGPPNRGVVIAVHGLGAHGARFDSLASELTKSGWAVLALDLPGHGATVSTQPEKSTKPTNRHGQVGSFDDLLAHLAAARRTARILLPKAKQVILGHSMGGNIALNYVLRQNEWSKNDGGPADGLVLLAPMILPPKPPPRPIIFAAWLTGYLLPWLGIRRPVELSALTRNEQEADRIRQDEKMHSRVTLYLATQLLSQGRWALDHARQIETPTLILYGQSDSLIDTSACEHLAIRIGDHATVTTWPDARHDLLHDTDRDDVIERMIDWLNQR